MKPSVKILIKIGRDNMLPANVKIVQKISNRLFIAFTDEKTFEKLQDIHRDGDEFTGLKVCKYTSYVQ